MWIRLPPAKMKLIKTEYATADELQAAMDKNLRTCRQAFLPPETVFRRLRRSTQILAHALG